MGCEQLGYSVFNSYTSTCLLNLNQETYYLELWNQEPHGTTAGHHGYDGFPSLVPPSLRFDAASTDLRAGFEPARTAHRKRWKALRNRTASESNKLRANSNGEICNVETYMEKLLCMDIKNKPINQYTYVSIYIHQIWPKLTNNFRIQSGNRHMCIICAILFINNQEQTI